MSILRHCITLTSSSLQNKMPEPTHDINKMVITVNKMVMYINWFMDLCDDIMMMDMTLMILSCVL